MAATNLQLRTKICKNCILQLNMNAGKITFSTRTTLVFQVISLPRRNALFLWLKLKDNLPEKTARDVTAVVTRRLRAHECSDSAIGFSQNFYKKIGGKQSVNFTYPGWKPDLPPRDSDILIHGKNDSHGILYQLTRDIMDNIGKDNVQQFEDIYGFTNPGPYGYNRDESGFIDGTRNPNTPAERISVAITGTGGSFGLAQKWIHDFKVINGAKAKGTLSGWIGRELESGAVLNPVPNNAHIARVKLDGIVRQSMPYGNYSEGGLFFLAYSKSPETFNSLLDNMSGTTGPKDLILQTNMSSNRTGGSYFYFPGKGELDDLF